MVERTPAAIPTIMTQLPFQKLHRNEHTDVDVEIISCTGPSNFYVNLKTKSILNVVLHTNEKSMQ
jgi:hypothetical protein